MRLILKPDSMADYRRFLKIKSLPRYAFQGRTAIVPDEYAGMLGLEPEVCRSHVSYEPSPFLFDYQRDIAKLAIRKRRYALFADCGLG